MFINIIIGLIACSLLLVIPSFYLAIKKKSKAVFAIGIIIIIGTVAIIILLIPFVLLFDWFKV